jgi:hypothetical protein
MGMNNARKEEEKCIGWKQRQEGSLPKRKTTQGKTEKSKKGEGEDYASTLRYCHKSHNNGQ